MQIPTVFPGGKQIETWLESPGDGSVDILFASIWHKKNGKVQVENPFTFSCAMVKSRYIGDGHPTFNRNPCNGYINPYYWVDDHPLLYGNNGSLDPGTVVVATL